MPTSLSARSELSRKRCCVGSRRAARNRWHQLLPDVLAQYNSRTHGGTEVAPNQAYSDLAKAEHARQVMQTQAKRNAPPRPFLAVGDRVRVRVKPRESRGAYRVTETAWTEQSYPITRIEHRHGSAVHSRRLARREASRSRLAQSNSGGTLRAGFERSQKRIGSERSAVGTRPGSSALMPARIYKRGLRRTRNDAQAVSNAVALSELVVCQQLDSVRQASNPTYVEMARRQRALSDGFVGWHLPPCSSGAKTPLTT